MNPGAGAERPGWCGCAADATWKGESRVLLGGAAEAWELPAILSCPLRRDDRVLPGGPGTTAYELRIWLFEKRAEALSDSSCSRSSKALRDPKGFGNF